MGHGQGLQNPESGQGCALPGTRADARSRGAGLSTCVRDVGESTRGTNAVRGKRGRNKGLGDSGSGSEVVLGMKCQNEIQKMVHTLGRGRRGEDPLPLMVGTFLLSVGYQNYPYTADLEELGRRRPPRGKRLPEWLTRVVTPLQLAVWQSQLENHPDKRYKD